MVRLNLKVEIKNITQLSAETAQHLDCHQRHENNSSLQTTPPEIHSVVLSVVQDELPVI